MHGESAWIVVQYNYHTNTRLFDNVSINFIVISTLTDVMISSYPTVSSSLGDIDKNNFQAIYGPFHWYFRDYGPTIIDLVKCDNLSMIDVDLEFSLRLIGLGSFK